ncbi:major apurinic/apyrimidinic endonuclease [Nadsonia fulvescens var. elongata DSM 6958]|uniref:Apurinic-apyrimidinic endonuclease 1 n=1 Tax=Nadsonia fulvescens var. elongata DSM 6958 TaxID=857566 RepID=A0A1E3PT63_9ASCO|nr:major apurinic/apyrimidinic endonuclease [Nadsonia fulvescens var. elongata DSM 6958]
MPPRANKAAIGATKRIFHRETDAKYLLGAHVSASGGVYNAIQNSVDIGANAVGCFLKNQRRWESAPYSEDDIKKFHHECSTHNYNSRTDVLPHGSYLINLANPNKEARTKSLNAFIDDLKRCELLGVGLYNFHPGSSLGSDLKESLTRIAEAINEAINQTTFVKVVLENMAGHGNIIGSKLEELAEVIEQVKNKDRVGVCIDTCHTFAAGYDIRTEDKFVEFWNDFDTTIGYKYLSGIHLNDSKAPLGSNRDLHQNIGLGFLGLESFRLIMNKSELQNIPLILETPPDPKRGDENRAEEIELLTWLTGRSADDEQVISKSIELQERGAEERKKHQDQFDKKNKPAKAKAGTTKTQTSLKTTRKRKKEVVTSDEEE